MTKIGDVVHARGIVERLSYGLVAVNFGGGRPAADVWVSVDDIVHVEPQPLKVGDLVRSTRGARGELLAVDGDFAWVRFPGGPSTINIAALERA